MFEEYKKQPAALGRRAGLYARALGKWLALAVALGLCCGAMGALFHIGIDRATALRAAHPWLLYCLPAAGLAIVGLYKLTGTEGLGTNDVIEAAHAGGRVPFLLLPAIFAGAVLTHLCGGSAGREGAALQMGGVLGSRLAQALRLDEQDRRIAVMAGMAAFFSALFGTPLGATVFAVMFVSVGELYHAALLPCLAAALTAYGVSLACGVSPTRFAVAVPELAPDTLARVAVLGGLCALVALAFCGLMHLTEHVMHRRLPNPWLRAALGGGAVVALTLVCGTTDYNGAGMNIVAAAVEQGQARPEAFALKMLFTAVTLAAGFKGGEVVPCFFVGATFGCAVGPLLGLPAGFAAALGLAAVFCGATNCPLSSIFLALEMFGDEGLLYFAVVCILSNVLSGYTGLYSSQTILYSKLKARYINVHTNAQPADGAVAPGGEG